MALRKEEAEAGISKESIADVLALMGKGSKNWTSMELAKKLNYHRGTAATALLWLHSEGYALRTGQHRSRCKVWALTDKGVGLYKQTNPLVPAAHREPEIVEPEVLRNSSLEMKKNRSAVLTVKFTEDQLEKAVSSALQRAGFASPQLPQLPTADTFEEAYRQCTELISWVVQTDTCDLETKVKKLLDLTVVVANAISSVMEHYGSQPKSEPEPESQQLGSAFSRCRACGVSDHNCWFDFVLAKGRPCCSKCKYTSTHNQAHPDYVAPWNQDGGRIGDTSRDTLRLYRGGQNVPTRGGGVGGDPL